MTDTLPTARSMLHADYLCVLVWCKARQHQAAADLQAIVDAGRSDEPQKGLKFRCTECGTRITDHVMMAKDALGVQPWRIEAG
jgi:DNA-directed RNA polymerase subunit RPC12/RpoP